MPSVFLAFSIPRARSSQIQAEPSHCPLYFLYERSKPVTGPTCCEHPNLSLCCSGVSALHCKPPRGWGLSSLSLVKGQADCGSSTSHKSHCIVYQWHVLSAWEKPILIKIKSQPSPWLWVSSSRDLMGRLCEKREGRSTCLEFISLSVLMPLGSKEAGFQQQEGFFFSF